MTLAVGTRLRRGAAALAEPAQVSLDGQLAAGITQLAYFAE
jgi:hypothetical protein